FFLDASRTPAIRRGPESFQGKHHAGLNFAGMFQRYETADYWFLPNSEANAVTILQRECGFFVRETELLRLRPHRGNLRRSASRAHQFNRRIEVFPAPLVRVVHRVRGVSDREAAVITGAGSHVVVENGVIPRVARTQHAVGENVRMRIAALP